MTFVSKREIEELHEKLLPPSKAKTQVDYISSDRKQAIVLEFEPGEDPPSLIFYNWKPRRIRTQRSRKFDDWYTWEPVWS